MVPQLKRFEIQILLKAGHSPAPRRRQAASRRSHRGQCSAWQRSPRASIPTTARSELGAGSGGPHRRTIQVLGREAAARGVAASVRGNPSAGTAGGVRGRQERPLPVGGKPAASRLKWSRWVEATLVDNEVVDTLVRQLFECGEAAVASVRSDEHRSTGHSPPYVGAHPGAVGGWIAASNSS